MYRRLSSLRGRAHRLTLANPHTRQSTVHLELLQYMVRI